MAQIDAIIQMNRPMQSLNKLNASQSVSCKVKDIAHSMLPHRASIASSRVVIAFIAIRKRFSDSLVTVWCQVFIALLIDSLQF